MNPSNPRSNEIPFDFPFENQLGSLSGAQPKLSLVDVNGKFYTEGNSPEQQLERYLMCEDLAHQGHAYCLRKIDDGTVSNPNAAMLRLHSGLHSKNWCTSKQMTWIVNRVADLGNWPKPQL